MFEQKPERRTASTSKQRPEPRMVNVLEPRPKLKMESMFGQKLEQRMMIINERKPELKMEIMAGEMVISLHLEDLVVKIMLKIEKEEASIT